MLFGLAFIGAALLYFLFKLYVSYTSEGGAIGMTPVLDGAIFPPLLATFGLSLLHFAKCAGMGDWIYILLWIAMTVFGFWAISYVGHLGRKSRRHTP